jgi:hypothetical protein
MLVYIKGAKPEQLVYEIVTAGVDIQGANIVIPRNLYTDLTDKLEALGISSMLFNFLALRCEKLFLEIYIQKNPEILSKYTRIRSFLSYSAELNFFIKLHTFSMLDEETRKKIAEILIDLTVSTPDGAIFKDEDMKSLLHQDEYQRMILLLETDVIENIDAIINSWASYCGRDDDPESFFSDLESMIDDLTELYWDDAEKLALLEKGQDQIKSQISDLLEIKEDYLEEEPQDSAFANTPSVDSDRSIFDDIEK